MLTLDRVTVERAASEVGLSWCRSGILSDPKALSDICKDNHAFLIRPLTTRAIISLPCGNA